jgi:hypothetical protein
VSLDEEARTGLSDRSVGRPADGGIQRLVLFREGGCGERGDEEASKLGEDMTACKDKPVWYRVLRVTFTLLLETGVLMSFDLLLPHNWWECVSTEGVSAHLTRAMIVFATLVRQSDMPSMRSSRRKSSSGGRPLAEQDARNFVTFDMRSLPSSRGSIGSIEPGCNLFISLLAISQRGVSVPFHLAAVTKEKEN